MNAVKIIAELCRMGNTEGCGLFVTPYDDDVIDFTYDYFNGGQKLEIVGDIKGDTEYLYSYDETLGQRVADVTLTIYNDKYEVESTIYLYEIE